MNISIEYNNLLNETNNILEHKKDARKIKHINSTRKNENRQRNIELKLERQYA